MLAANREVAYISEPLNIWHRPGVMRAPVEHWYTYISPQNEASFQPALEETLTFRYHFWEEIRSVRALKDVLRMGRDASTFITGKLRSQRPLVKDPFAVFSAPWFAQAMNCQVVITVRHPAAFASSLQRLDWPFDFSDFLQQPALMADWLEPYQDDMRDMLRTPEDIIGQSSLLWRMVYQTVAQFKQIHPQFIITRHEDLSRAPAAGYKELYQALGLNYTPRVEQFIRRSSSKDNPREISKTKAHATRLDSQANIYNWKNRLSAEQIKRIRYLTADVAPQYYSDSDWE
jgi:hypothetical protein